MKKRETSDSYIAKYLILISEVTTQKEIARIIDRIYEDGFEDGVNSKEK